MRNKVIQYIVIKHLSGSLAPSNHKLPLGYHKEIVFGYGSSRTIIYDPSMDKTISPRHAKIIQGGEDMTMFFIEDLGSSYGTYVNEITVSGQVRISPGDVIRLGTNGPEFQFDLEPLPQEEVLAAHSSEPPASLLDKDSSLGAKQTEAIHNEEGSNKIQSVSPETDNRSRPVEGRIEQARSDSDFRRERAGICYKNLAQTGVASSEVLYLDAEVLSSPTDMFEETKVYLQETGHAQGAFVMFADPSGNGWVFPNPNPELRIPAQSLKRVFPNLTTNEFDPRRDKIHAARARRVEEGRWIVEPE